MDDLIGTIAEKAGISETQAKLAATAALDHFDDKLPAPVVAQIKSKLGLDAGGMLGSVMGDAASGNLGGVADMAKSALGGGASDAAGMIGGLLGKK